MRVLWITMITFLYLRHGLVPLLLWKGNSCVGVRAHALFMAVSTGAKARIFYSFFCLCLCTLVSWLIAFCFEPPSFPVCLGLLQRGSGWVGGWVDGWGTFGDPLCQAALRLRTPIYTAFRPHCAVEGCTHVKCKIRVQFNWFYCCRVAFSLPCRGHADALCSTMGSYGMWKGNTLSVVKLLQDWV